VVNGAFRFTQVPPGRYTLFVSESDRDNPRRTMRTVDVTDRNINGVTVTLGASATVKGQIVLERGELPAATDAARPTGARPRAGANLQAGTNSPDVAKPPDGAKILMRVQLRESGNSPSVRILPEVRTSSGSFEIPDVPPGDYQLTVDKAESSAQVAFYTTRVTVGERDIADTIITVPEGAAQLKVTVTLDTRVGTVTGKAFDPNGDPLPNTPVFLVFADPAKRALGRWINPVTTSRSGEFMLRAVIPDDYLLFLWPGPDRQRGANIEPEDLAEVATYAVRITVSPSETVTQELRLTSDFAALVRRLLQ